MALFFENELKGQSKRKLWMRIEKDMIDVVQKHELDSFLYLTIIVYVKGKYPNAKVPKYKDKDFRKNILEPFKNWLLDYKISPPGLTLQQFNAYYPSWIREFYNQQKHEQMRRQTDDGLLSYDGYQQTRNIQFGLMTHSDRDTASRKPKKYHPRHHRIRRQPFLIPINENDDDDDNVEHTIDDQYELLSEQEIDFETRTKNGIMNVMNGLIK